MIYRKVTIVTMVTFPPDFLSPLSKSPIEEATLLIRQVPRRFGEVGDTFGFELKHICPFMLQRNQFSECLRTKYVCLRS